MELPKTRAEVQAAEDTDLISWMAHINDEANYKPDMRNALIWCQTELRWRAEAERQQNTFNK